MVGDVAGAAPFGAREDEETVEELGQGVLALFRLDYGIVLLVETMLPALHEDVRPVHEHVGRLLEKAVVLVFLGLHDFPFRPLKVVLRPVLMNFVRRQQRPKVFVLFVVEFTEETSLELHPFALPDLLGNSFPRQEDDPVEAGFIERGRESVLDLVPNLAEVADDLAPVVVQVDGAVAVSS